MTKTAGETPNSESPKPTWAREMVSYTLERTTWAVAEASCRVTLAATRTGNDVTGAVTLSRAVAAGDTVSLRWREQGSTGPFANGPITTLSASANPSVTVTTAIPVEVVARVIVSSGSQFDSPAVVV